MGLLVKFIAAEDKKEIEHEEYVNKIFEDLCNYILSIVLRQVFEKILCRDFFQLFFK